MQETTELQMSGLSEADAGTGRMATTSGTFPLELPVKFEDFIANIELFGVNKNFPYVRFLEKEYGYAMDRNRGRYKRLMKTIKRITDPKDRITLASLIGFYYTSWVSMMYTEKRNAQLGLKLREQLTEIAELKEEISKLKTSNARRSINNAYQH